MYDLLVATSAGVRLTPASGQPFSSGGLYSLQATSAETNVASVSSYLGLRVKVLTALVEGSPVADFIRRDFRSRGMEVEAVEVPQGGPWGHRHQINMADSGFGLRGPRVWNDRAGEVGLTLKASDFDLERIFGAEGVRMMHLSGLIAAMAPEFCLALASAAREHGTLVSFDLNYRASFWEGRADKLREAFRSIAAAADILIGNEEDFQLCLGFKGPEAGGKDLDAVLAEDRLGVVVLCVERAPDLAGAVVPHAGRAQAEAGVGNVELVPEAPGAALRHVRPDVGDVARPKL